MVETFPDGNSALMMVCARLRHVAGTQWGSLAQVSIRAELSYLISNIKKLLLSENKLFFPQYGQVHVQPFVDISSKQLFHRGGFALHVVRIKSIIVSKAVGKLNIDRR